MRFELSVDLVNKALEWAQASTRATLTDDGELTIDADPPDVVVGDLITVIVSLYLRFQGHEDARQIRDQAVRLVMEGGHR